MQQTVKDRIKEFIQFKNISPRAFEKRCNLSNGYLRQLRNSPTANKIEIILSAFPELNRAWLMSGKGEMLKGESQKVPDNQEKNAKNNINISINVLKTMEEQAASLLAQSETMRSLSESIKTRDRQIDRMLSMLEELQQRAFSGDSTRSIDIRADLDAQNPPPVKIRQK